MPIRNTNLYLYLYYLKGIQGFPSGLAFSFSSASNPFGFFTTSHDYNFFLTETLFSHMFINCNPFPLPALRELVSQ